ncbi:LysR family transcriptional regulator [soil metagenome]
MELRQIRFFIRLAETLHFGRAAEKEYVAQSVISLQISKLETELGAKLLDRSSHRVRLTEAGEAFLVRAREITATVALGAQEARAAAAPGIRSFRVGIFGEGAGPVTHHILRAFTTQHPKVDLHYVELSMVNQIESLIDGDVDIALIRLPISDQRVRVDPLLEEPRVAGVPVDHPLASATDLSIDDLLDLPFAVAAEGAPAEWRSYWSFDEQRGANSRVGAEVRSIPESLATIAYRNAVDTLPSTAAVMFPHEGVRYLPLRDAEPTRLAVVTRADDTSALADSFRIAAREQMQAHLHLIPHGVLLDAEFPVTQLGSSAPRTDSASATRSTV